MFEEHREKLHGMMWSWWNNFRKAYEIEISAKPAPLRLSPGLAHAMSAIADLYFLLNRWGPLSFLFVLSPFHLNDFLTLCVTRYGPGYYPTPYLRVSGFQIVDGGNSFLVHPGFISYGAYVPTF